MWGDKYIFFSMSEHNPPYFHAMYGEYVGEFRIETLEMIEGDLPPRAMKLIKEWGFKYQKELLEIWNTQKFKVLEPLS
ncbi:MAG: DUF4160 domain-containing protein [bacterium]|nr:DUF4160 domain-containing protein [bacterium]